MAGLSEDDLERPSVQWTIWRDERGSIWPGAPGMPGEVLRSFRARGADDAIQMLRKVEAEQAHLRQQAAQ